MSNVRRDHLPASPDTNQNGPVRLRTDTLAHGVIILLAVSAIQRVVGFGRGVLFCRWLDPVELGYWELAFSFLLLAAPVAVLGLPGSFGRYVEHFRKRGQLRTFLRRTTLWTSGLGLAAVATITLAAPHFSQLIFGSSDKTTLVMLMAISLGAIMVHHFLECLLAALRMFRIVAGMQFCQSLGFAAIGILLLFTWKLSAASIVVAYGTACLLSSAGTLCWIRNDLRAMPNIDEPLPQRDFWSKLLQFSIWVWVINLLSNLFSVIDRYMIVYYGGMDVAEALSEVGQYHSSRVVPLLLVSIACLLSSLITPYLSRDWEAGRRQRVSLRLNLILKLVALGMMAASVAIMFMAPLLFQVALGGKYSGGLNVLPWTLTYCSLFGITALAQNYLWCAEKVRKCSLPLLLGLVGNVALNLVLLPHFRLLGAVVATTIANLIALTLTMLLSQRAGMKADRGTWILCAALLTLVLGPWTSLVVLIGLGVAAVGTHSVLSQREKRELTRVAARYHPLAHKRSNPQASRTEPAAFA